MACRLHSHPLGTTSPCKCFQHLHGSGALPIVPGSGSTIQGPRPSTAGAVEGMTSASTENISRTREGVPIWDGDAATFIEYAEAAELYEQTTAYHKRNLVAPRLVAELQGPAKKLVVGQPATWVSYNGGVARLLDHLRQGLGQPKIPELTEHLHRYFRQSRRRNGETINSYVARKTEIYLRAQQAMKRIHPVHTKDTSTSTTTSSYYQWPGYWWSWGTYGQSWGRADWGSRPWEERTTAEEEPAAGTETRGRQYGGGLRPPQQLAE